MTQTFNHGYALLIGIDKNQIDRWALPAVRKDIEALKNILTNDKYCAYNPENVKIVGGENATNIGIKNGLQWLVNKISTDLDATALIYYSGHGIQNKNIFYYVPYDFDENPQKSGLNARTVANSIIGIQPKRLLVILDCCHAEGMGVKDEFISINIPSDTFFELSLDDKGNKATLMNENKGFDLLTLGRGRAVINSCRSNETSHLMANKAMSVFTYYVISALTGAATPQDGAKTVLVSDLIGHVTRKVPSHVKQERNDSQNPVSRMSDNFPIALLVGGKGWVEGVDIAPDPIFASLPNIPKTFTRLPNQVELRDFLVNKFFIPVDIDNLLMRIQNHITETYQSKELVNRHILGGENHAAIIHNLIQFMQNRDWYDDLVAVVRASPIGKGKI